MFSRRDIWMGAAAVAGLAFAGTTARAAPLIIRVPIDYAPNGMPVLPLTIGGQGPYHFLLDTGAFACMIREDLAKSLKLRSAGSIRTGSVVGHEDSYIYQGENILIGGGLRLPHMSLIGMAHFPIKGVDGVLPASILTALPSQLDYEGKEIRYYLNGADMDLDGFHKIDAEFQAAHDGEAEKVFVPLTLDGHKMLCAIDTGAGTPVLAGAQFVADHKLWDKYPLIRASTNIGGNGQTLSVRIVRMPNIDIGDLHIDVLPVALTEPKTMDNFDDFDGLIGTPLLRRFTLAFTGHKELYLKPNAAFAQASGIMPELAVPAAAPPGTVPFLYGQNRQILLSAHTDGHDAMPVLLSTAEVKSKITAEAAALQGLPRRADGGYDASGLMIGEVRLPHLVMQEKPPLSGPMAALGLDFLTALPMTLDFESHTLSFHVSDTPDFSGFHEVGGLAASPDHAGASQLFLNLRFEGQDISCLVDTATTMALVLMPKTVTRFNLWDRYPKADKRIINDDGRTYRARFPKLAGYQIGPFAIPPAAAFVVDPSQKMKSEVEAVIGMGFLHRFTIGCDKAGRLYFRPNRYFDNPNAGPA
ncbi:retroviral-like aspartic protease family protein [Asticcacaulis sp. EMRT-3]|uniref:retroviral-like aspartic protease family protein n=1 Tax=Asticcacaulis sp. EMRT-3 TaxID=3040349 RepID=UPI0024AFF9E7|nr:retroviral-like aspartic protease family protein [Asticcacaulis sp. EMRT-3]MDI7776460.1 retroviral-like aspartic protease family protein [Asticcacaulis sp. EMRT-3]